MKTQTIKPKDGETYLIENYNGELVVNIQASKPLKNLILQFPDVPFRASTIKIHASQDIQNLNAIGTFKTPFTMLKAGNIGFVYCPIGKEYIMTGKNEIPAIVKINKPNWKLIAGIGSGIAASSAVLLKLLHIF